MGDYNYFWIVLIFCGSVIGAQPVLSESDSDPNPPNPIEQAQEDVDPKVQKLVKRQLDFFSDEDTSPCVDDILRPYTNSFWDKHLNYFASGMFEDPFQLPMDTYDPTYNTPHRLQPNRRKPQMIVVNPELPESRLTKVSLKRPLSDILRLDSDLLSDEEISPRKIPTIELPYETEPVGPIKPITSQNDPNYNNNLLKQVLKIVTYVQKKQNKELEDKKNTKKAEVDVKTANKKDDNGCFCSSAEKSSIDKVIKELIEDYNDSREKESKRPDEEISKEDDSSCSFEDSIENTKSDEDLQESDCHSDKTKNTKHVVEDAQKEKNVSQNKKSTITTSEKTDGNSRKDDDHMVLPLPPINNESGKPCGKHSINNDNEKPHHTSSLNDGNVKPCDTPPIEFSGTTVESNASEIEFKDSAILPDKPSEDEILPSKTDEIPINPPAQPEQTNPIAHPQPAVVEAPRVLIEKLVLVNGQPMSQYPADGSMYLSRDYSQLSNQLFNSIMNLITLAQKEATPVLNKQSEIENQSIIGTVVDEIVDTEQNSGDTNSSKSVKAEREDSIKYVIDSSGEVIGEIEDGKLRTTEEIEKKVIDRNDHHSQGTLEVVETVQIVDDVSDGLPKVVDTVEKVVLPASEIIEMKKDVITEVEEKVETITKTVHNVDEETKAIESALELAYRKIQILEELLKSAGLESVTSEDQEFKSETFDNTFRRDDKQSKPGSLDSEDGLISTVGDLSGGVVDNVASISGVVDVVSGVVKEDQGLQSGGLTSTTAGGSGSSKLVTIKSFLDVVHPEEAFKSEIVESQVKNGISNPSLDATKPVKISETSTISETPVSISQRFLDDDEPSSIDKKFGGQTISSVTSTSSFTSSTSGATKVMTVDDLIESEFDKSKNKFGFVDDVLDEMRQNLNSQTKSSDFGKNTANTVSQRIDLSDGLEGFTSEKRKDEAIEHTSDLTAISSDGNFKRKDDIIADVFGSNFKSETTHITSHTEETSNDETFIGDDEDIDPLFKDSDSFESLIDIRKTNGIPFETVDAPDSGVSSTDVMTAAASENVPMVSVLEDHHLDIRMPTNSNNEELFHGTFGPVESNLDNVSEASKASENKLKHTRFSEVSEEKIEQTIPSESRLLYQMLPPSKGLEPFEDEIYLLEEANTKVKSPQMNPGYFEYSKVHPEEIKDTSEEENLEEDQLKETDSSHIKQNIKLISDDQDIMEDSVADIGNASIASMVEDHHHDVREPATNNNEELLQEEFESVQRSSDNNIAMDISEVIEGKVDNMMPLEESASKLEPMMPSESALIFHMIPPSKSLEPFEDEVNLNSLDEYNTNVDRLSNPNDFKLEIFDPEGSQDNIGVKDHISEVSKDKVEHIVPSEVSQDKVEHMMPTERSQDKVERKLSEVVLDKVEHKPSHVSQHKLEYIKPSEVSQDKFEHKPSEVFEDKVEQKVPSKVSDGKKKLILPSEVPRNKVEHMKSSEVSQDKIECMIPSEKTDGKVEHMMSSEVPQDKLEHKPSQVSQHKVENIKPSEVSQDKFDYKPSEELESKVELKMQSKVSDGKEELMLPSEVSQNKVEHKKPSEVSEDKLECSEKSDDKVTHMVPLEVSEGKLEPMIPSESAVVFHMVQPPKSLEPFEDEISLNSLDQYSSEVDSHLSNPNDLELTIFNPKVVQDSTEDIDVKDQYKNESKQQDSSESLVSPNSEPISKDINFMEKPAVIAPPLPNEKTLDSVQELKKIPANKSDKIEAQTSTSKSIDKDTLDELLPLDSKEETDVSYEYDDSIERSRESLEESKESSDECFSKTIIPEFESFEEIQPAASSLFDILIPRSNVPVREALGLIDAEDNLQNVKTETEALSNILPENKLAPFPEVLPSNNLEPITKSGLNDIEMHEDKTALKPDSEVLDKLLPFDTDGNINNIQHTDDDQGLLSNFDIALKDVRTSKTENVPNTESEPEILPDTEKEKDNQDDVPQSLEALENISDDQIPEESNHFYAQIIPPPSMLTRYNNFDSNENEEMDYFPTKSYSDEYPEDIFEFKDEKTENDQPQVNANTNTKQASSSQNNLSPTDLWEAFLAGFSHGQFLNRLPKSEIDELLPESDIKPSVETAKNESDQSHDHSSVAKKKRDSFEQNPNVHHWFDEYETFATPSTITHNSHAISKRSTEETANFDKIFHPGSIPIQDFKENKKIDESDNQSDEVSVRKNFSSTEVLNADPIVEYVSAGYTTQKPKPEVEHIFEESSAEFDKKFEEKMKPFLSNFPAFIEKTSE